MNSTGVSRGTVVLIAGVAASSAALLAWAVMPAPPPRDLRQPDAAQQIHVTAEPYTDARDVELVPTIGTGVAVGAPRAGVLTAYDCAVGSTVASGIAPLSLDGRPVLALHTDTPLWRDISPSTPVGADIRALQSELERLGYPVGESGRFDVQTRTGFAALADSVGLVIPAGAGAALADLIWLPDTSVVVDDCNAYVGKAVAQGEALVGLRSSLESARLRVTPIDGIPGERAVEIGGDRLVLDENGSLRNEDLQRLAETDAFRAWQDSDGQVPLSAIYVLAEPLMVLSVPPTAVVQHANQTCIYSGDVSIRVTVVASRLGQSLVTAATEPSGDVDVLPQHDSC